MRSFIVSEVVSGAPNGLFGRNICLAGLNRLRYSDLIAVKTIVFFGETSPQTFVAVDLERIGGRNTAMKKHNNI